MKLIQKHTHMLLHIHTVYSASLYWQRLGETQEPPTISSAP